MIKAVIFDFDSTLVDYHYGDEKAINKVIEMLPEKIDKRVFYERSGEYIRQFYNNGIDYGSEIHKMRLKKTIQEYGMPWNEKYLKEFMNIYLSVVKPYEGAIEVLQYLKNKVKIGLLTNSTDAKEQRQRIQNSKMECYFDKIMIAKNYLIKNILKQYNINKSSFI